MLDKPADVAVFPAIVMNHTFARMRTVFILFASFFFLAACSPKPLSKRIPGTWLIHHYDEYTAGRSTGHLYDRAGYIAFSKKGTGAKKLSTQRPHGALASPLAFRYTVSNTDSLVTILDARSGEEIERWLVTSNYPTYQEWVSVNESRDTVRTMYLMKR